MQQKLTPTLLNALLMSLMATSFSDKAPSYPAPPTFESPSEKVSFELAPSQAERDFVIKKAKQVRHHKKAQEAQKSQHSQMLTDLPCDHELL